MIRIHPSWQEALAAEFEAPYFSALTNFVRAEYAAGTCYPPAGEIFAAFDRCPFPEVKVVLLGQDPYHGAGQAEGLCFSVRDGVPPPPSLQNIFKELHTDLGIPVPTSGSLRRWADQGVLLLSAPEPPDRTKDKAGKPSPMPSFARSPLVAKGLCSYFGAPMPDARPHSSTVRAIAFSPRRIPRRFRPIVASSVRGLSRKPTPIWLRGAKRPSNGNPL